MSERTPRSERCCNYCPSCDAADQADADDEAEAKVTHIHRPTQLIRNCRDERARDISARLRGELARPRNEDENDEGKVD